MTNRRLRCAHCGSNAVVRTGGGEFRCEHCGAEGPRMRTAERGRKIEANR